MAAQDEEPRIAGADDDMEQQRHEERFPPEEEASMVADSNAHKTEANSLFGSGKYDIAINKYDEALAVLPNYLDYELAVLRSNIAACHLKLEEWKEAVTNATAALDSLDKLEGNGSSKKQDPTPPTAEDEVEGEIVSSGAKAAGPALGDDAQRKRLNDISRIRAKALMRRARARSELGGWSNLEGAIEDYKRLSTLPAYDTLMSATDKKIVSTQLRALPARAKAAQEKETAEMWAKLKDLGNGILKPFGLSTDSFKMVKDEKTGAYSMNFAGGSGGK
ncbi:hypothetical protein QC763_303060 [Podospora pseudopauciseta]|uniref:Tetratricopeptide repeat protein 1 n=2 Tax=Podospora TaxID=5144 RepID=A0ABR0HFZ5_9PEZI|nr:hypothetical protein QC763_303060 [Podospora pseudopauciseta]KAK4677928.1 hypothetical protein QC764_303060 [Podospora pseudoanserina]